MRLLLREELASEGGRHGHVSRVKALTLCIIHEPSTKPSRRYKIDQREHAKLSSLSLLREDAIDAKARRPEIEKQNVLSSCMTVDGEGRNEASMTQHVSTVDGLEIASTGQSPQPADRYGLQPPKSLI